MIDAIIDTIKVRLDLVGIEIVSVDVCGLWFRADGNLYYIKYTKYCATISDGISSYGSYLYVDDEFCDKLIKRIRTIVRPTSIWNIVKIGSYVGLPSILDE